MNTPSAISSLVIEHNFDPAMLEQIDTLRTIRLNLAEKMLSELDVTSKALSERGLLDGDCDHEALRQELTERVETLRSRMQQPKVIYADEISLYVDLLEQDLEIDESLQRD